jgi:hypothetical protein
MAKIYISSTWEDLASFRAEVCSALRRLRHDVLQMEDYTARSGRPLDECLADVASCDVYIGLFAWRRGFVPAGHRKGITELELEEAQRTGKTVLLFLLAEDQPWPPKWIDEDKRAIVGLRERLQASYMVEWFRTPHDLASRVATAVVHALPRIEEPVPSTLTPEGRRFLCNCLRKYLSEIDVQNRVYAVSGLGLLVAGMLGLLFGVLLLEAEKSMLVGAGSLLFFSASSFPFVTLRSARSKKTLFEVCVADLEGEHPSAESVRFAKQLLDHQLSGSLA